MNPLTPKTPPQKPSAETGAAPRGVFGYDVGRGPRWMFWREMSQMSFIAFLLAVGVAAIVVVWKTGWASSWYAHLRAPRDVRQEAAAEPQPQPEPAVPTHRRDVDGVIVPEDQPVDGRYYAVMLDNLGEARPQSGHSQASVVYEAPVEAGITRLMAVFRDTAESEKIGAVRSARPYFLDWAAEYDAMYVHVGGSPEALEKITQFGVADMNEFFNSTTFWRSKDRLAPHNVYTSAARLSAAYERRFSQRAEHDLQPWKFKDDADAAERTAAARTLVIDYGSPGMNVTWTYDPAANAYARKQGVVTKDGAVPIMAKNVAVLEMPVAVIDAVGRRRIDTVGKGDATFAIDGNVLHGSWSKESRTARTRFLDAAGNEIALNAGQTWVNVVPVGTAVTEN